MQRTPERDMFYGAKPATFEKAKLLRNQMTDAEKTLWERLRNKQILSLRFKAQHPIDVYIVDFYCHPLKLVIEVDGGIHHSNEQKEHDKARSEDLEDMGLRIIRFTNEEVIRDTNVVVLKIEEFCKKLLLPPTP